MADKKLRIKIIPDVTELKKSLSKLAIGGDAAGGAGGGRENKQVKEEGVRRSKESSKILTSLKNIIKFVSIAAFVAALFAGLIRVMEPFFKLISVILTLLFLPLIPLLKPVLLILAEMAKTIASSAGAFLTGDISLGEFIGQVGEALINAVGNIIPIILDVFLQIFNALSEALPKLIPIMGEAFNKIIAALSVFLPKFVETLVSIIEGLVPFIPQFIDAIVSVIVALIPLIGTFVEAFVRVIEAIIPVIPKIVPSLIRAFVAIVEALIPLIPQIMDSLIILMDVLVRALFAAIIGIMKASVRGFFFGDPNRSSNTSVDDAIIRPNGQIIRTDPADTLIATKNPGALFGGGGGFSTFAPNITINANINSEMDIRTVAEKIAEFSKDELSRRTTLFNF